MIRVAQPDLRPPRRRRWDCLLGGLLGSRGPAAFGVDCRSCDRLGGLLGSRGPAAFGVDCRSCDRLGGLLGSRGPAAFGVDCRSCDRLGGLLGSRGPAALRASWRTSSQSDTTSVSDACCTSSPSLGSRDSLRCSARPRDCLPLVRLSLSSVSSTSPLPKHLGQRVSLPPKLSVHVETMVPSPPHISHGTIFSSSIESLPDAPVTPST